MCWVVLVFPRYVLLCGAASVRRKPPVDCLNDSGASVNQHIFWTPVPSQRERSVARVGHIDRRTQEGSSRLHALLYACHPRHVNGYGDSIEIPKAFRKVSLESPA